MKKNNKAPANIKTKRIKYCSIGRLCKLLTPVFSIAFYVAIGLSALLAIIALIVLIVNVKPEDMLLPPHMKKIFSDGGILESFSISLGNGVRVVKPAAEVALTDIKTVIYGFIGVFIATLCALAPCFRFLSKLLEKVGDDKVFEPQNARMINYIGITVMFASTIIRIVSSVVNYSIYKIFVSAADTVMLKLDIDFYGVAIGLFILLTGYIYGYACSLHNTMNPTSVIPTTPSGENL